MPRKQDQAQTPFLLPPFPRAVRHPTQAQRKIALGKLDSALHLLHQTIVEIADVECWLNEGGRHGDLYSLGSAVACRDRACRHLDQALALLREVEPIHRMEVNGCPVEEELKSVWFPILQRDATADQIREICSGQLTGTLSCQSFVNLMRQLMAYRGFLQEKIDCSRRPGTRTAKGQALACLFQNPNWSDRQIAKHVGCHVKSLYRWEEFKLARVAQRRGPGRRIRGSRDATTGTVEAWAETPDEEAETPDED